MELQDIPKAQNPAMLRLLDNEAEIQLIAAVLINCEEGIYTTAEVEDYQGTAGLSADDDKYDTGDIAFEHKYRKRGYDERKRKHRVYFVAAYA